jgi:antitoxin (DNA-binding transcriptional repressor) of toxin-antitoxin stability system
VNTWTVSEARGELPQILAKVAHGEEVTLTKHGRPIAVIVRPDTLRARRAGDALAAASALDERIAAARRAGRPRAKVEPARAALLVRETRAGRDAD